MVELGERKIHSLGQALVKGHVASIAQRAALMTHPTAAGLEGAHAFAELLSKVVTAPRLLQFKKHFNHALRCSI